MALVGKLFGFGDQGAATPIPTPAIVPDLSSVGAKASGSKTAGLAGTILTGPSGLQEEAATTKKALTGS